MRKKLFTLLLAIVASVGICKAWDDQVDGIYYVFNTSQKTATVSYKHVSASTNSNAYRGTITIPSTVTYNDVEYIVNGIGTETFHDCDALTSIILPPTIKEIGRDAFINCSNLNEIYITDYLAWCKIKFYNVYSNPLVYAGTLFVNQEIMTSLRIPDGADISEIGDYAFINCPFDSIILNDSIRRIGVQAFAGCYNLKDIYIGKNIVEIGENAFFYCNSCESVVWNAKHYNDIAADNNPFQDIQYFITSFVFGSDVEYIPAYLCCDMENIQSINIPEHVIGIGENAFYNCSRLKNISWDAENCSDFAYLNGGSNAPFYSIKGQIQSFTIGNNVKHIPAYLCYGISNISDISLPSSLLSIGNSAFSSCTKLTSVSIPESIVSIGESAFSMCNSLQKVYINDIGAWCTIRFNGVYSNPLYQASHLFLNGIELTNLVIPEGTTSIAKYAFHGFKGATSVTIPNSLTDFGVSAFSIDTIFYEGTLAEWCNLEFPSIWNNPCASTLEYNHTYTLLVGGASGSYYTDKNFKSNTILYIEGEKVDSLIIGNDIERIKPFSFAGCASIKSVIYNNNNLTDIAETAFWGCVNLETLEMRSAGNKFWGNQNLRNIIWNVSESIDFSYKNTPFYHDNTTYINEITNQSTKYMSIAASIKRLYFGESVTSIPNYLCYGMNNVDTIVIPCIVEKIPQRAFDNCSATLVYHNVIPGAYVDHDEEGNYRSGRIYLSAYDGNGGHAAYDYAIINDDSTTHYSMGNYINSLTKGTYKISFFSNSGCAPKDTWLTINRYAMKYGDCYYQLDDNTMTAIVTYRGENYDSYDEYSGNITIPESIIFDENEYKVIGINSYAFSGCSNITSITMEEETPITMYNSGLSSNCVIYVPYGSLNTYKSASEWSNYTIHVINSAHITKNTSATSATITLGNTNEAQHIVTCGMEGEEEYAGNVIEYIGLDPNREYTNISLFIKTREGDYDTLHISFTTTALELTTKPSKPVSATTAILLAETNMSDAEVNCGFEYKRNDAPADMSGTKVYCPVANGQMAGRLKNLKDDVYYKYRAFYQSTAGNTYYGDWQYIFTGDLAVEFDPILYTYGATVVQENEATISGYALAGSEDFTEQGFEYWAESRANGGASAPHRMAATIGEHKYVHASGIKMSVTLTDLDEGTVYKYRAYGKTGNQFFYGSEQTFTTPGAYQGSETGIDEVPSDQVQNTKAQKILREGQIYILYNGTMYNIQGQKVK